MHTADTLLQRLATREPVEGCVALVVAHPDDEVIGAGAVLPLFQRLVLVHVTDGAPGNLADAHAHGFADAAGYAAARRGELGEALKQCGFKFASSLLPLPSFTGEGRGEGRVRTEIASVRTPSHPHPGPLPPAGDGEDVPSLLPPEECFTRNTSIVCEELNAPDQGASDRLVPLTHTLRTLLAHHGAKAILTHPYEGGHPDHDATAFIAAHCGLPMFEFASYHAARNGGMQTGSFLPGPEPVRLSLTPAEQARKRTMLAAFKTQAATLAPFGTETELFRRAPTYDFTRPPHDGALHYERHDWGMTGARWRSLATEAHRILC